VVAPIPDPHFFAYLAQHDDGAWHRAVNRMEGSIHRVDRVATRIWFHFFPLAVQRALNRAPDAARLARYLRLEGRWRLADQRDTSHAFLFGHRYWGAVWPRALAYASHPLVPGSPDLTAVIQDFARRVAAETGVEVSRLVGIVAVALRTLQQLYEGGDGEALGGSAEVPGRSGEVPGGAADPDAVLARRARATPGAAKVPSPCSADSCSCGTCWVGVLGGGEKLSPMDAKKRETLQALGYVDTRDARPVIRLACMAQALGAVSIVLAPWNGQIGVRLIKALAGPLE
jgi:ferredoxin